MQYIIEITEDQNFLIRTDTNGSMNAYPVDPDWLTRLIRWLLWDNYDKFWKDNWYCVRWIGHKFHTDNPTPSDELQNQVLLAFEDQTTWFHSDT